jgi:hypothetical protein
MSVNDDLLNEIEGAIGASIASGYSTANAANDLFEGYVWSIVIGAARDQGGAISYENVNGVAVSTLVFRTSPGRIYSKKKPYTHAIVQFPSGLEVEVHLGVFVEGRSRVLHECDIAVVDRAEAYTCRAEQVHPRVSKVPIAIECKFHSSTLQLGYGRGFLGLTADLSKPNRFLVSNVGSANIERLATYHGTEWDTCLDLQTPDTAANLRARLARSFRNLNALR